MAGNTLQVKVGQAHQSMPDEIHRGAALFQRDVTQQRLVLAVRRRHVDEQHLAVDGPKSRHLDAHRAAHRASHHFLGCHLHLHRLLFLEGTELRLPNARQRQMAGAGIDHDVELSGVERRRDVPHLDARDDSSHSPAPERIARNERITAYPFISGRHTG